jgi:hypothetical protein
MITTDILHSRNGENPSKPNVDQIRDLTDSTEQIAKGFASTVEAVKSELEVVTRAINTWEKMAPHLYFIKKRLQVIDELLSGKRDIEAILNGPASEEPVEKKKRKGGGKRTFVRKKSDILTDEVIDKIKSYIGSDENYHKSKEIYTYLIDNNIIETFPGDNPDRAFALALTRVDQDKIKYFNHYSIMAWGLPDFGTPEHARRKALKDSVRGKDGTRITSYNK